MRIILTLLIISFFNTQSFGENLSCFYRDLNIEWHISPKSLIKKWRQEVEVLWFGKGVDYKISKDKEGQVHIFWQFAHHPFISPGPDAITGPLHVSKNSAGYFLIHIVLPESTIEEAELLIKAHEDPYYIVAAGKSESPGSFEGKPTVLIETEQWKIGNDFQVVFE